MIDVNSDRSEGMRRVGRRTRKRVLEWFTKNPGQTIADCAKELKLSWPTVKRHVVAIQKGERFEL